MSKITVSIVMATYNGSSLIDRAIRSVLDQSYTDFEFIIVNDGSTDKSLAILHKWQELDKRIIVISNKENLGLTRSLNIGIHHSKGEYIGRIDDDDSRNTITKLEKQVNFMEENPSYGLVGTNLDIYDEHGNKYGTVKMRETDTEIRNSIMLSNQFAHPSVLIRKSILDSIGLYDETFDVAQDGELRLRIGKVSKFYNMQFIGLNYTKPQKTSRKKYYKQRIAALRLVWMYAFRYPNTLLGFLSRSVGLFLPETIFQYIVRLGKHIRG